ncbi:MAG: ABC transporter permease [Chloroflexi bacterium]|nr:ABC transporter permease [Chloroflexota bacterium]
MFQYVVRRILYMVPTLIAVTIISFVVIELPPGDYLTNYVNRLMLQGEFLDEAQLEALKVQYGLGQPIYIRYLKWMSGVVRGNFGVSMEWGKPVGELIGQRLLLTVVISLATTLFIWAVAMPIGIYSATHQYSIGDYIFSFIGFVGVGVPEFMIALIFLWVGFSRFGVNLSGLFSEQYVEQGWSFGKVVDMLKHMWVPLIVLGLGGTAGMIRTTRANLLDELRKPYVTTARSKGLTERKVIWKYPVRLALNPFVSGLAYLLPGLVGGSTIISVVLSLPTSGPLYLKSLQTQDMYLAGTFVLMFSVLTVIGTLISDILLGVLDPRIRYE